MIRVDRFSWDACVHLIFFAQCNSAVFSVAAFGTASSSLMTLNFQAKLGGGSMPQNTNLPSLQMEHQRRRPISLSRSFDTAGVATSSKKHAEKKPVEHRGSDELVDFRTSTKVYDVDDEDDFEWKDPAAVLLYNIVALQLLAITFSSQMKAGVSLPNFCA